MKSLALVPVLLVWLCCQVQAEVCVIYTAYNYAGDSKPFCGIGDTVDDAVSDAKLKARNDGYRVPGGIVYDANTCSNPLCLEKTMHSLRSSPVIALPWKVKVCIPCQGPPLEVTMIGKTYAEAFCLAKRQACQMAYERNADPENPFKCQCRYKSMILEKPCSAQSCPPTNCIPRACKPRSRCMILQ